MADRGCDDPSQPTAHEGERALEDSRPVADQHSSPPSHIPQPAPQQSSSPIPPLYRGAHRLSRRARPHRPHNNLRQNLSATSTNLAELCSLVDNLVERVKHEREKDARILDEAMQAVKRMRGELWTIITFAREGRHKSDGLTASSPPSLISGASSETSSELTSARTRVTSLPQPDTKSGSGV